MLNRLRACCSCLFLSAIFLMTPVFAASSTPHVWKVNPGQQNHDDSDWRQVNDMVVGDKGKFLYVADEFGTITKLSASTGEGSWAVTGKGTLVSAIALVVLKNDGEKLYAGSDDKTVKMINADDGAVEGVGNVMGVVQDIAIDSAGKKIAIASQLWFVEADLNAMSLLNSIDLSNWGSAVGYSVDDKYLYHGRTVTDRLSKPGLSVYAREKKKWSSFFLLDKDGVNIGVQTIAVSPKEDDVFYALVQHSDLDKTSLYKFEVSENGNDMNITHKRIAQDKKPYRSLAISDDGQYLAVGNKGGEVMVMNIQGEPLVRWQAHREDDDVTTLAFGKLFSKNKLFSASADGAVIAWDIQGVVVAGGH
jgi:WD40 repeat protein